MDDVNQTPLTASGRARTLWLVSESERTLALQQRELAATGLSAGEVQRAIEPLKSFVAMLREDAEGNVPERLLPVTETKPE